MRNLKFNRVSLGLVVACGVVVATIGIEFTLQDYAANRSDSTDALRPDLESAANLPNHIPPAFDSFTEVLERPLFFANRELPPEPVAAAVKATPREPLRLSLEGIVITGSAKIALLRDLDNNTLLQMAEGMAHNGWTLESLQSDGALFERDGEAADLRLETATGARQRRR